MTDLYVSAQLIGGKDPLFDEKAFRRRIAATNQKFAKRAKRSFQATTRTWSRVVVFHQRTSVDDLSVEVYTLDDIYRFINDGTAIRYAVMTEDFSPKTRPGLLGSMPGAGGFARMDFRDPREGIEAREFDRMVEEKHGPEYQRAIEEDLEWAMRKGS